jgi:hypothetical protein
LMRSKTCHINFQLSIAWQAQRVYEWKVPWGLLCPVFSFGQLRR